MDGNLQIITDKNEMANVFNNYFSNIGKKLAAAIDTNNDSNNNCVNKNTNSIFLSPVSSEEKKSHYGPQS